MSLMVMASPWMLPSDALAEGPDDVDVQFVDVHCLPDADLS